MTDNAVAEPEEKGTRRKDGERPGLFGRISLYWRQVWAELRKVVTPTREETIRYVWIVLGFVAVVMVIVFVFDSVFGFVSEKVFGG